jgi:hypothetical protein
LDDHPSKPTRQGRGGSVAVILIALFACSFWMYQGVVRRHRLEWLNTVKSLGLTASIIPASQWNSQMVVPGPQPLLEREIVIVMVDTESQGKALLRAPAECPYDTKIYAFDGLPTRDYVRLEERFQNAVVFTRISQ